MRMRMRCDRCTARLGDTLSMRSRARAISTAFNEALNLLEAEAER